MRRHGSPCLHRGTSLYRAAERALYCRTPLDNQRSAPRIRTATNRRRDKHDDWRTVSNISPLRVPAGTLDDDAWDDLLSYIEERRVIPIVGPELLMVETDRGARLLFEWAAERLAARLNINTSELPKPHTLNDVVCLFLA